MLTVDPSARISLDGVLAHAWIARHTPRPDAPLGPAYVKRLRAYALRRRVKVAALVAAFGARHLQRARDLRRVFSAKCLSPADFSALSAAFHRAAVESAPPGRPPTHTVNIECFRDVLASVEVTASLSADRLFAVFDADGSGDINAREFLVGLARTCHPNRDEALRLCFNLFDDDGNGFLTLEELLSLITMSGVDFIDVELPDEQVDTGGAGSVAPSKPSAGIAASPDATGAARIDNLSPDGGAANARSDVIAGRIARAFSAMDTNADGKVSFEEFRKAIYSDSVIAEALLLPFSDGFIAAKLASRSPPSLLKIEVGLHDEDASPPPADNQAQPEAPAAEGRERIDSVVAVNISSSRLFWCCC